MGDRLTEFEERLTRMETSHRELATAFDTFRVGLDDKLDTITTFVTGANTIFGLARRHWKRVFIFGAGVMTSAGFGNPKVWAFVSSFAGG